MSLYRDIEHSKIAISGNLKEGIRAKFNFSANLELFKGHFPSNPILPGIAQIEMVKFTLETIIAKKLFICEVKKTKFSHPIEPEILVLVSITIPDPKDGEERRIPVQATVRTENALAGKINLFITE